MNNPEYLAVVSSYNNDVEWLPSIFGKHLVISKGDKSKVTGLNEVKAPNIGSNIYTYLMYIYENYENLHEKIFLIKGNVFPRHVDKEFFLNLISTVSDRYFVGIEQSSKHNPKFPIAFINSDGGYNEINNSWYSNQYPSRYFNSYDKLAKFLLKNYNRSPYIRFSPGANYFITKNCIYKYPKNLYYNLSILISHDSNPVEAHILERFIYNMWSSEFDFNDKYLSEKIDVKTIPPVKLGKNLNLNFLLTRFLSYIIK